MSTNTRVVEIAAHAIEDSRRDARLERNRAFGWSLILLVWLACFPRPGRAQAGRVDEFGDPLPAGAIARIGLARPTTNCQSQDLFRSVAFAPHGRWLAIGDGWGGVHAWDALTGRELARFPGEHGDAATLAVSPSEELIAAGGELGRLTLMDVTPAKVRCTLELGRGWITSLAFSPDGGTLAVGFKGSPEIALVDVKAAKVALTLSGHASHLSDERLLGGGSRQVETACVQTLAFAEDGSTLMSVAKDGEVGRWTMPAGKLESIRTVPGFQFWLASLSRTGDSIALRSDKEVTVVKTSDLKPTWTNPVPWSSDAERVRVSPSNRTVAVGQEAGEVLLFNAASGAEVFRLPAVGSIYTGLDISTDGRHIAGVTRDGRLHCWDTRTKARVLLKPRGHTARVTALAFSPDGTRLASLGDDKTLRIWETEHWTAAGELAGPLVSSLRQGFAGVAFSPDGKRLVSIKTGGDNTGPKSLVILDFPGLQLLSEVELPQLSHVLDPVVWSPDGTRIALASTSKGMMICDAGSGQPVATLTGAGGSSLAYSADGRALITGDSGGVIVRDLNGAVLHTYQTTMHYPARVVRSPTGDLLAAGTNNDVDILNKDCTLVRRLSGHGSRVGGMAFSPDGKQLATASGQFDPGGDNSLRLWEVSTGRPLGVGNGHNLIARAVAYSAKHVIATAGYDHSIMIWDPRELPTK